MRIFNLPLTILFLVIGSVAVAQQPEFPGPEPEHAFLKKFVGKWTTSAECKMGPDQPAMKTESTTDAKMIGELWLVNDISGEAMGAPMKAMQTIGYDSQKKKYVGTWIDSMFGHLWQYEGVVDSSGTKLTLETSGPDFMTGKGMAKYRDVYEFKSADKIFATSFVQDENGQWAQFVTAQTKRIPAAK